MAERRLPRPFDCYLGRTEIVIYSILAALLALNIAAAGQMLSAGLRNCTVRAETLRVLKQLLIVEPFLAVGLTASIRRILVLTLEAARPSEEGAWQRKPRLGFFTRP